MSTAKPKILFITRNFPPLTGGMERLAWESFQQIEHHFDCTVIGPRGCGQFLSKRAQFHECPMSLPLFLISATLYAILESVKQRFSLRIGGSGLVAPVIYLANIIKRSPTLTYVHGLDLIIDNLFYQRIFLPFIRNSTHVIANSKNTRKLAIGKGIKPENITVINPGVDTSQANLDIEANQFEQHFQLHNRLVLLSVGRLVKRKGLAEFIEYSLPIITARHPQTTLLIVGSEANEALKKEQSILAKIKHSIAQAQCEDNVIIAGRLSDNELAAAYNTATVHVFPVLDLPGDVEGFGMVALEAAAHGVTTVAFDSGGVADAVKAGVTGQLVAARDYLAMAQEIICLLDQPSTASHRQQCLDHAAKFSWPIYGEKLNALCIELIEKADKLSPH
jgi:phosphatidyl-myo-inositol dimannoside synthase